MEKKEKLLKKMRKLSKEEWKRIADRAQKSGDYPPVHRPDPKILDEPVLTLGELFALEKRQRHDTKKMQIYRGFLRMLRRDGKRDPGKLKEFCQEHTNREVSLALVYELRIFLGEGICPICYRKFVGRTDKTYCSDRCRKAASRLRKSAQEYHLGPEKRSQ